MQENTGGVGQVSHPFKKVCYFDFLTILCRIIMILAIFTRFHAFVLYVLIKYNIIIIFVTPRPQPEQKPDPSPSGTGCQPESGRVPIFLPDPDPNRTLTPT